MAESSTANCPLCGAENHCAVVKRGCDSFACWCQAAKFTPEIRALIASRTKTQQASCVCARCVEKLAQLAHPPS